MVVTRAHVSAALAALAAAGDAFSGSRLIDTSLARPAGVVVPVIFAPEPRVLFILRGAKLKDHAGEVGFPGGKPEPGEGPVTTALRETREEVGIDVDAEDLSSSAGSPPPPRTSRAAPSPRRCSSTPARVCARPRRR